MSCICCGQWVGNGSSSWVAFVTGAPVPWDRPPIVASAGSPPTADWSSGMPAVLGQLKQPACASHSPRFASLPSPRCRVSPHMALTKWQIQYPNRRWLGRLAMVILLWRPISHEASHRCSAQPLVTPVTCMVATHSDRHRYTADESPSMSLGFLIASLLFFCLVF